MSPQTQHDLAAVREAAEMYHVALQAAEVARATRDRLIREAHGRGASLQVIGDELGLSKPNISRIVNSD